MCDRTKEQATLQIDGKPHVASNRCTECGYYISAHRVRGAAAAAPPATAMLPVAVMLPAAVVPGVATTSVDTPNHSHSSPSSSCYTCASKKVVCNGTDSGCAFREMSAHPAKRKQAPAPPDSSSSPSSSDTPSSPSDDSSDRDDNDSDRDVKPKRLMLRRYKDRAPKRIKQENCPFTYDELIRYTTSAQDLLKACTECNRRVKDHVREATDKEQVKHNKHHFRLPDQKYFPIFRDARNAPMHDPALFLRKLDRQLSLHEVPRASWEKVLVSCVTEDLMQEWIDRDSFS
jgi:hypothetical protein